MDIILNPEQKKAVQYQKGPLLIIAGAGTGKTTVITERVKFLIEKGLARPSEILALTFTERAAQEMEERVDKALPMGYVQTWILTFHSFCERILRAEAIHIGLSYDFTILSPAETYLFVKDHLFEFNLKYFKPLGNPTKFIAGLVTHFTRLQDEDVNPAQYLAWVKKQEAGGRRQEAEIGDELDKYKELAKAYQKYQQLKQQANVMDFADLISHTLRLFRKHPNVLRQYQRQFKYLLVDEFQDTNYAQNHLALLLTGDDQNITAVSDDDQAIYRFRGAAVYNVLDFKKHFPQAKVVTLTKNYRSPQEILDRAYTLIQNNNPNRLEIKEKVNKKLQAQLTPAPGQKIQVVFEERVEDEAEKVAAEISKLVSAGSKLQAPDSSLRYKDIAILVRANNHAQPFIQALNRHNIPHQFLGPGKLYQRSEIKDLIAYLKVLDNFTDNTALYRVLVMPQLAINRRDVAALVNFARRYNLSLFEAMEKIVKEAEFQGNSPSPSLGKARDNRGTAHNPIINQETRRKIEKLTKLIHHHLNLVPANSPGQILYYFVKDIGLLQKLARPQSELAERQALNISRFFDKIKTFESRQEEARVKDMVSYLNFVTAAGESPLASQVDWSQENAVNIITIHSAKGLEFPVVFLVNLVNERFPTRHRSDQIPIPDELAHEPLPEGDLHTQEERRLFYVGLTRAKQKLYLTGAKFYGEGKRPKKLSPFVYEALREDLTGYMTKVKEKTQPALFEWAKLNSKVVRLREEKNNNPDQKPSNLYLQTSHLQPPIPYLSYTQLNTFQICPLHYKLRYILKIPTLPSSAVSFGRTLHETLREFYENLKMEGRGWKMEKLLDKLLGFYAKHWLSEGYTSKAHETERKAQGEKYLRDFLAKEFDPKTKVLALEEPFKFKINTLKVGGRIDRIDQLPDGGVEIIDYKTGPAPKNKPLKKDLQLLIYALAVNSVRDASWQRTLNKIKLSYYYFEGGQKITLQPSSEDLSKAQEEILKIRREVQQSDFKCSGSLICRKGCEYALFCNTEDSRA